jgi:hypothetical protein
MCLVFLALCFSCNVGPKHGFYLLAIQIGEAENGHGGPGLTVGQILASNPIFSRILAFPNLTAPRNEFFY